MLSSISVSAHTNTLTTKVLLMKVVVVLLVAIWGLLFVANPAAALNVRPTTSSIMIEVGDEELCLYSRGKDHYEGVSMHYLVVQGQDDFDVYVRNSDNRTIYASFAGEHDIEDRVYFTTRTPSEHSYCIDNRPYSKTKKLIKMDIGLTSLKRWKRRIDPLNKFMQKLDGSFLGMHEDQILARIREQTLRESLERVFSLIAVRSATETVVIVVITFLNVVLIAHLLKKAS